VEPEEYARIAAAEDEHWWYRNARALMSAALGPWLGRDQLILDAGCGPGGNAEWLARHGRVVGIDLAPEALELVRARRRSIVAVRGSVEALPFPRGRFDVVIAVTVMYTVPDDSAALRELARVLRPGGVVVVLEPAFPALRRAHDSTVHGRRRYRRTELAALATSAGLRVERSTYACSFLAPAAAGLAVVDRLRRRPPAKTGSDVERRWLDEIFAPLAGLERRWLERHRVPFGTSVLIVASRPA
jgi:SAM-dependent methyltransferase